MTRRQGKQFSIYWEEEEYQKSYIWSGEFPNAETSEVCKTLPSDRNNPEDWVYLIPGRELPASSGSAWQGERSTSAQGGLMYGHLGRGSDIQPSQAPAPPTPRALQGTTPFYCHPTRFDIIGGGIRSLGLSHFRPKVGRRTAYRTNTDAGPPAWGVYTLSPSPKHPERVWAATYDARSEVTGLWRTDDRTDTWNMVRVDPYIQNVHVHQADDRVIYTNHSVSRNGGTSWETRDVGDLSQIRPWDRMRSHSTDASILYVCHPKGGLRKWTDYLLTDSLIAPNEEYKFCRDLLVFPDDPERLWLGADNGLFESLDGGQSWSRQNRGLPNAPILKMHLAPDRSEILAGMLAYGLFALDASEVGIVPPHRVSIDEGAEVPAEVPALLPNFPNPFGSATTLHFTTPQPVRVRLDVFDVLGRRVETVVDQRYGRGVHQVRWNSESLSRGVYLVRMQVDGRHAGVQKVVRR